jgi:hypothetical protein
MNTFVPAINRAADAWSNYVWHALWQAAVVGLAILAIVFIARRWPSPLRYGLLLVALIKFAAPPFLSLPTGPAEFSAGDEATITPAKRSWSGSKTTFGTEDGEWNLTRLA